MDWWRSGHGHHDPNEKSACTDLAKGEMNVPKKPINLGTNTVLLISDPGATNSMVDYDGNGQ